MTLLCLICILFLLRALYARREMEVWQEIAKNVERGAERLAAFLAWVFLSDKIQKHGTDKIPLTSVGGMWYNIIQFGFGGP